MHQDHDKFTQAVKDRRKVIITYFSGEYNLSLTKLCVPLQYSPPGEEEDPDYYYLWDSEGDVGMRVLAFPSSHITYMELSDDGFDPDEYIIPETEWVASKAGRSGK